MIMCKDINLVNSKLVCNREINHSGDHRGHAILFPKRNAIRTQHWWSKYSAYRYSMPEYDNVPC